MSAAPLDAPRDTPARPIEKPAAWRPDLATLCIGLLVGGALTFSLMLDRHLSERALWQGEAAKLRGEMTSLEDEQQAMLQQIQAEVRRADEAEASLTRLSEEATAQLSEARQAARQAESELQGTQIASMLATLNGELRAGGAPITLATGSLTTDEIRLTIEYRGFRVTEREALVALEGVAGRLRATFPRHLFPEQYDLTFIGTQNDRRHRFRHGLWEQEGPAS